MSTLTLVRHGQAQQFQRASAPLSPVGVAQAAALGSWWLRNGDRFDEVWTGALPRQRHTAEVVARCFRESGADWPELACDAAWNEYDATGVLDRLVPTDPRLATLARDYEAARGGPDQNRRFQRMFEAAMSLWLEENPDGAETWPAFRDRVSQAILRLQAGPPGRRVAVFTSGGPIGFAVQFAMKAPARSFLEVNWRVRNASVSEFIFDRERFTLDSFNSIAHLEDAALRTYR